MAQNASKQAFPEREKGFGPAGVEGGKRGKASGPGRLGKWAVVDTHLTIDQDAADIGKKWVRKGSAGACRNQALRNFG